MNLTPHITYQDVLLLIAAGYTMDILLYTVPWEHKKRACIRAFLVFLCLLAAICF